MNVVVVAHVTTNTGGEHWDVFIDDPKADTQFQSFNSKDEAEQYAQDLAVNKGGDCEVVFP